MGVDRADFWRAGLSRDPRPGSVRLVVVDADGVPVGFLFGGAAAGDPGASDGEVYALNVHPEHWGSGAGTDLLAAAQRALAAAAFDTAVLWVAPGNQRARRFYEHRGWRADGGSRTEEVLGVVVEEVRYRRDL